MPPRRTAAQPALQLGNVDPKIEQMLRKLKVNYTYISNVPTSQINMDRSRAVNVRTEPLNEETKREYVAALQRGDMFPPLIVYRPNRGTAKKYKIADGVHRAAAHHEAGKSVDVYELSPDTPAATISKIARICNTKNGLNLTPAERVNNAVSLKDDGLSMKDAADIMGIRESALRAALNLREADNRAKAAKIDIRLWEDLSKTVRARLNAITTDPIFKEAAILAHDVPLNASETSALVAELRQTKDLAKQREILKSQETVYKDRIKASAGGLVAGRGAQTPKHRINLVLGNFPTLIDPDAVVDLFPGEEREEILERLELASAWIDQATRAIQAA
jgi:ParB-like chromosome segregation protein Spo0J